MRWHRTHIADTVPTNPAHGEARDVWTEVLRTTEKYDNQKNKLPGSEEAKRNALEQQKILETRDLLYGNASDSARYIHDLLSIIKTQGIFEAYNEANKELPENIQNWQKLTGFVNIEISCENPIVTKYILSLKPGGEILANMLRFEDWIKGSI